MPDKVELIAYADRLGGDLAGLKAILDGPLQGLFGGLHILPFFRTCDGADAGFDPADHTEVDSRLGSWNDVAALAEEFDVMVDVIINHVSASDRWPVATMWNCWNAAGSATISVGTTTPAKK